ncbi:MAG: hypothetical protein DRI57_27760 [Deltaproteobacteria bacterium]|nr:MAG: hypothetical protein DRI57_27760 [Deltaproteobacteria bacterium]
MEKASALLDRTIALCHKTPKEVPDEIKRELEKLRPLVKRQEEKLKANQFEVAVLGLEKAGKSTLLNAWLGVEILPAMDERCTYTSCEIWSAPGENDQCYIIEYYPPEEFEKELAEKRKLIKELPKGFSERGDIEKDVQEIEAYYDEIQSFLRQGRYERKFSDVDEVREDLKQAIAINKAQARAIRRIILKTIKLRADRDIIFHDVPGFNSPLKLHKALAEDKLRRCDAILYAKEHDKPDLVDSEVNMLRIADEEDPHIRVAGKIFIALTRIDNSKSCQLLDERIEKARDKWKDVPESRIIPVSPPARLYNLGTGGSDIMRDGKKIIQDLENIGVSDGIDELKNIVSDYIDTDRAQVLERRCKGLLNDADKHVSKVIEILLPHYPDNPEELEQTQDDEEFNVFINWWKDKWNAIQEDFASYYTSEIMPKDHADAPAQEHERLRQFQIAFNELADRFTEDTLGYPDEKFEIRYKTLGLTEEGIIHPQNAHIRLREELHQKALDELNKISSDLAKALEEVIHEIGNWVFDHLWKIEKIRDDLLESSMRLHERVEHGMSTLFLRFARPAVTLFLLSPRGLREHYISAYHSDIVLFGEYYQGENAQHLKTFLERGTWIAEVTEPTEHYLDVIDRELGKQTVISANLDEIKTEIREDLNSLNDYLKNSIFHAAGFISYCRQELDQVKSRFLNNENRLMQQVRAAYRRKHPPLMEEKTLNIENYEFRRGIIIELAEVQKKLAEIRSSAAKA